MCILPSWSSRWRFVFCNSSYIIDICGVSYQIIKCAGGVIRYRADVLTATLAIGQCRVALHKCHIDQDWRPSVSRRHSLFFPPFFSLPAKLTPVSDREPSSVMIRARHFYCKRMRNCGRVEVIGWIFSSRKIQTSWESREASARIPLLLLCDYFWAEPLYTLCHSCILILLLFLPLLWANCQPNSLKVGG